MGERKKPFTAGEGSMSKLHAGETAVKVTDDAIQTGATPATRDYAVGQWHRDARTYTPFEGTPEIQRLIIARAISGVRIA
jgi:acyl-CoA dehydrogenase